MLAKKETNLGKIAENDACGILSKKGYKIITRNFRSIFGEIDIIAEYENCSIFIEVKARQSLKFGYPQEAVTKSKIEKIVKTANYYILRHPMAPKKMRIEVVSMQYKAGLVEDFRVIKVF